MKTYSYFQYERLLEAEGSITLKSGEKNGKDIFMDSLANGEFTICIEDTNVAVYDNIFSAEEHFGKMIS